jgi:outer membrane protein assembly factor BamA
VESPRLPGEPDIVSTALADYETGLARGDAPAVREYRPRLSLEGIGQPYLSSGGGPFGTFVRGGGAVLFGDMLGERRLGAAIQIGNRLHDTAVELRYVNQERRWTWGGVAELEPGIARFRTASAVKVNDQEALLRQTEYFQRMQVRTAALLAYPFSRGLRVEMFGGIRHAQYHRDQRVLVASAETGDVIERERLESSGGSPTTVAEFGAALVRDTTVFGPTGPLLGARYRVEVAPTAGHLRYTSVLADVRQYVMPVRPYTIAMRMVHAGRYGRDRHDSRLLPSYLGSSYFVRGHRSDLQYCTPDASAVCGEELLGNRLLVGNVELRFPLLGAWSRQIDYRVIPIDAFFFADAGVVSSRGGRTAISSIGAGLRTNAGGLPLEIGAVRALDGPRPRWQFDMGFRVGF